MKEKIKIIFYSFKESPGKPVVIHISQKLEQVIIHFLQKKTKTSARIIPLYTHSAEKKFSGPSNKIIRAKAAPSKPRLFLSILSPRQKNRKSSRSHVLDTREAGRTHFPKGEKSRSPLSLSWKRCPFITKPDEKERRNKNPLTPDCCRGFSSSRLYVVYSILIDCGTIELDFWRKTGRRD